MHKLFFIGLGLIAISFSKENKDWSPFDHLQNPTSSFLENRGSRYHAGVDLSTDHTEGLKVYAPEDGQIIRLRQSPWGYGKAVYFRGKSGYLYVFAHLSGFEEKAWNLVYKDLAKQKSIASDFRPNDDLLTYQKGDIIAFSGSTGIGEPHLHVEIREEESKVVNPYKTGFKTLDTLSPELSEFWIWKAGEKEAYWGVVDKQTLKIPSRFAKSNFKLALKIVDWAELKHENPMSIHQIILKKKNDILFNKNYDHHYYGHMNQIKNEILFDDVLKNGDWHLISSDLDSISNIKAINFSNYSIENLSLEILDDSQNKSTFKFEFLKKNDSLLAKPKPIKTFKTQGGWGFSDGLHDHAVSLKEKKQLGLSNGYFFDFEVESFEWQDSLYFKNSIKNQINFSPLGLSGRFEHCFKTPEGKGWGVFYQNSDSTWSSYSSRFFRKDLTCSRASELSNVKLMQDQTPPEITFKTKGTYTLNGKVEPAYIFQIKEEQSGLSSSKHIKSEQKIGNKFDWVYSEFKGEKNELYIAESLIKSKVFRFSLSDEFQNQQQYEINLSKEP